MAPFMTPWSVRPVAGCPKAAARSASFSTLHAPSSSEYSEWTCRCATVGVLIGEGTIGVAADAILSFTRILRLDVDLLVARCAPRRERVRDLYGPRRFVPGRSGAGGVARGQRDVGRDG